MQFYPPFSLPFYFNNYKYPRFSNSMATANHNNINSNNSNCINSNYNNENCNSSNFNNSNYNNNNNSFELNNNFSNSKMLDKPQNQKKASETNEASEAFFEIFGLKLYFDDILIMCILFFLYTEKVHDDELFICLILLLLT